MRKESKIVWSCLLAFTLILAGCKLFQSHQQVVFDTLYSVEQTTTEAYDAYLKDVISGAVSTNNLPKVSKAFNEFQQAALIALDAVQFSTNAPAPVAIADKSVSIKSMISASKGK